MRLHLWGTDFRRSHADLRAKLFLAPEARQQGLSELLKLGFSDIVYLYTCNRVEFYTTAENPFQDTRHLWSKLLEQFGLTSDDYYRGYHAEGKSAMRHMMRVASSLESLVVGEPQILGQLKEAIRFTKESGLPLDSSLERCFHLAFETAKKVRTQTALGEKAVSVATLGLQHLQAMEKNSRPVESAVLVGRSPMNVVVLQWLLKNRPGTPITWVNRNLESLEAFSEAKHAKLMSLSDFLARPVEFSHLFTATASATPVFTSEFFEKLSHRPVVFDFAQPPDVEMSDRVKELADVIHLEDLNEEARRNAGTRAEAISQAEAIIDEALKTHCLENKSAPLLKEFSQIDNRCLQELAQALSMLEGEVASDHAKIKRWAEKLVKKNLHQSKEHLKELLKKVTEPQSLEV